MDLLESGELGQQMGGEPEEAFGLTDLAQGDLQVGDAPGSPARAGQAKRMPSVGSVFAGAEQRPGIVDDRIGYHPAKDLPGPIAERCEKGLVMDLQSS